MRNLLAFLAAAVLAFLGLGWYLDWYKIQSVPSGTAGHQSYNIEFNDSKINKDVQSAEKNLAKKGQDFLDKKNADTNPPVAAPKATGSPSSGLQETGGIVPKVVQEVEEFRLTPGHTAPEGSTPPH
jgi:hypothetical protein